MRRKCHATGKVTKVKHRFIQLPYDMKRGNKTDDYEKIDFLKLERVSRFVFLTAWELAYRKKTLSK